MRNRWISILLLLPLLAAAQPLTTSFSYQGSLSRSGSLATGVFDLQFELFDALENGAPVGVPIIVEDVAVVDGIFTVTLDFGAMPFAGDQLWLEIGVREGASVDDYQGLAPRQAVTATPYALHAEMVAMDAITSNEIAANAVGVGEIDSSEVQRRLQGACAAESAIRQINADGSVVCEADDVNPSYWTPNSDDALEPDRSLRIEPGTPFPMQVRSASAFDDPQLALVEDSTNQLARLSFYNAPASFADFDNPVMWTIAAQITGTPENDRMNFFNRNFGDVLSLTGDGLVGVNTVSPLASLDLRSDDQFFWGVGNGRGDFYLGDGQVGLSMGTTLAGDERGTARIWTKGGVERLLLGSETHGDQLTLRDGNIGLGNSDPGVAVDIAGQIRARDLAHGDSSNRAVAVEPDGDLVTVAPQTRFLSLSPAAFTPRDSATAYFRTGQFVQISDTGLRQLWAPVNLPHGALVTEVTFWFRDNSSEDLLFQLFYYSPDSTANFGAMAAIASNGASTDVRSVTDNSISQATIDTQNRNYAIVIQSTNWQSQLRVHTVRITYTL
ncbi:MAG: hypothetical protein AAF358_22725 [Pseudomonadota bacterium]